MKLSEKFYSRGSNIDKDIGNQSDWIALTNQTKRAYLSLRTMPRNIRQPPPSAAAGNVTAYAPSTISQGGVTEDKEFTIQAALSLARSTQTSNIVDSKSYYDIMFRTTTAGIIKTIEMDFPAGTNVGSSLLVEAVGIGPGTIGFSAGEIVTYTVTNPVNVPANTKIRIQLSNINNPPNPSTSLTVSITTRDSANVIIDGPTPTNAYNIKQIGTGQIADGAVTNAKIANSAVTTGKIGNGEITTPKIEDNAVTSPKIADGSVTSTKPAESFTKRVTLLDNAAGNAKGWNPDNFDKVFTIEEPQVSTENSAFFIIEVQALGNRLCAVIDHLSSIPPSPAVFIIACEGAPEEGSELHYVVGNLPPNVS
jgi:hypothetical protein